MAAILQDEGEILRSITNTYDTFGRLIQQSVKWASNAYYTNRYVYDDQWRMLAWYYSDPNTAVVIKYVYGPGIDEPVRLNTGANGTNYYYHAAALDTVTELTDGAGVKVEQYSYDVYGTPTFRDGNGNPRSDSNYGNVLLFQGRVRDRYLGLYNFRNRYYSPSSGRFVQVDPARVDTWSDPSAFPEFGELNLYQGLLNNPVLQADPFGRDTTNQGKAKPGKPKNPPSPPKCNTCAEIMGRLKKVTDPDERKGDKDWIVDCYLLCDHICGGSGNECAKKCYQRYCDKGKIPNPAACILTSQKPPGPSPKK